MKRMLATLVLVPIALALALATVGGVETDAQKKIAHIQKLLADTRIDTTAFPEEMPLRKFLAAVRQQLPGEKSIALRLEKKELGKEAAQLADAPVRCAGHKKWSLHSILHKAVRQVSKDVELDYAIRADGIVITRAPLAANSFVYNVGDILREMPSLLPRLKKESLEIYGTRIFEGQETTDSLSLLVQWLSNSVPLRPWEKIEILNGTRLAVLASPYNHEGIADVLAALRRISDNAVVMNARLYEVDRGFFKKNIAPLFAKDKAGKDRPTIAAIDSALLAKIVRQKMILESEDHKLLPNETKAFLSRHSVFRFLAARNAEGAKNTRTGLAGVSFEVRPLVSADRLFLRLHITQHVAHLVAINKIKTRDAASGKDVETATPNVCKSSLSGTVQIPDTAAILMPVAYRPQGKDADNRMWLLVARPYIWIEAEQKERGPGGQTTSKEVWDSEVPKEEEPPAANAKPLVLDEVGKAILQAVVSDILSNPQLADTRKFYGTEADKTFTLLNSEKLAWPKGFKPKNTHGYKLVRVRLDPFKDQRRVLGIRLDKFDLTEKPTPFSGPIKVSLFNGGGSAFGLVIDSSVYYAPQRIGSSVYYAPKRIGKRWTVEFLGLLDP